MRHPASYPEGGSLCLCGTHFLFLLSIRVEMWEKEFRLIDTENDTFHCEKDLQG